MMQPYDCSPDITHATAIELMELLGRQLFYAPMRLPVTGPHRKLYADAVSVPRAAYHYRHKINGKEYGCNRWRLPYVVARWCANVHPGVRFCECFKDRVAGQLNAELDDLDDAANTFWRGLNDG